MKRTQEEAAAMLAEVARVNARHKQEQQLAMDAHVIYEDAEGRLYHAEGKTCWFSSGTTKDGIEQIVFCTAD